jgi:ribose 5-phosphate isomerase B
VKRRAITEANVRAAARSGSELELPPGALVTPAAHDLARQLGVRLVTPPASHSSPHPSSPPSPSSPDSPPLTVSLGADHGGYPLKQHLAAVLAGLGYHVLDVGTDSTEPVDYPAYALAVARAVVSGAAWRGIMVDGAGIGSCMAANKVAGVRAALCHDLTTARNAREHNDANVLTLGGSLIGARLATDIVTAFLATPFAGGRHEPRVALINSLDAARS